MDSLGPKNNGFFQYTHESDINLPFFGLKTQGFTRHSWYVLSNSDTWLHLFRNCRGFPFHSHPSQAQEKNTGMSWKCEVSLWPLIDQTHSSCSEMWGSLGVSRFVTWWWARRQGFWVWQLWYSRQMLCRVLREKWVFIPRFQLHHFLTP